MSREVQNVSTSEIRGQDGLNMPNEVYMGLWGTDIYLYKLIFIFASNSLPLDSVTRARGKKARNGK